MQPSEPLLKVASAGFTDFGVVWFVAALAANSRTVLLRDLVVGIVAMFLAYQAEQLLKKYYDTAR